MLLPRLPGSTLTMVCKENNTKKSKKKKTGTRTRERRLATFKLSESQITAEPHADLLIGDAWPELLSILFQLSMAAEEGKRRQLSVSSPRPQASSRSSTKKRSPRHSLEDSRTGRRRGMLTESAPATV